MPRGYKTGGRIAISNEARFWKFVQKSDNCWAWMGSRDVKGYGKFGLRPACGGSQYISIKAHRYAYFLLRGPIPEGKVLDHIKCDNPSCVNPWHLIPSTNRDNTLRGKGITAICSRKTVCKNGHAFSPENTYQRKDSNGRKCRECMRQRSARIYRAHVS